MDKSPAINGVTGTSILAVMSAIYTLLRTRENKFQEEKKQPVSTGIKNLSNITIKGNLRQTKEVYEKLNDETKNIIAREVKDGKTDTTEQVAERLSNDETFLNSLSSGSLFNNSFVSNVLSEQERRRNMTADEEQKKAEQEEIDFEQFEKETLAEQERKEIKLARNMTAITSGGVFDEEIKAREAKIKTDKEKKDADIREKRAIKAREKASQNPTTKDLLSGIAQEVKGARRNISDVSEQVTGVDTNVQELKVDIKQIMSSIQQDPRLKTIETKIRKQLEKKNINNYEGVRALKPNDINKIIATIPASFRSLLAPAVEGLMGNELNLNQVIAGLVGLSVAVIPAGSLLMGMTANVALGVIFETFDIDMNNILTQPEQKEREDKTQNLSLPPPTPGVTVPITLSDQILDSPALDNSAFGQFVQLYDMAKMGITQGIEASGLRRPTQDEIKRGALAGGAGAVVTAGASTGSYMGALSGGIPGLIGGAVAGGLTAGVAESLSRLIERKLNEGGVEITSERKKQIKQIVQIVPPAAIGGYLGYTPSGSEVIGTGVTSGAGITERKLIATPDVIAQTQVVEVQKPSGYKVWQPKSISPTTDILDVPKQEKYADDLEFIAFNYIAPGTEGGYGDTNTNPLKRSQATADAIRFTDAGVYVPYLLWNKINDTNDMKPERLEQLALGAELPPMEFMEQDNETTFEEVANIQFPNGENTAIEFLSPYADFSNVENFWMSNPTNVLFTVNP